MGGGGGGRGLGPGSARGARNGPASAPRRARAGATCAACCAVGTLPPARERDVTALVLGTAASLAPPLLAKVAIDEGIDRHDTRTLVLVVIAFLFSALLVWAMTYVQTYLVGWVGQRALADLRIRIFTHLQHQPIGFYESRPAGRADLTHDQRRRGTGKPRDGLGRDAVPGRSHARRRGRCAVVSRHGARAADVLCRPVRARRLDLVSARLGRRVPAHAETIGAITAYLQETLSGIRVVRSFGQEPCHEARFAELNIDNCDANMVTVRLNAAYFPTVEMFSGIALAVIVLYGGYQALEGTSPRAPSSRSSGTLSYLFEPIQQLSQLYTTYQSGMAALEKISAARHRTGPDRSGRGARARAHPRRSPLRGCLVRI